jgi:hypothetical protein
MSNRLSSSDEVAKLGAFKGKQWQYAEKEKNYS